MWNHVAQLLLRTSKKVNLGISGLRLCCSATIYVFFFWLAHNIICVCGVFFREAGLYKNVGPYQTGPTDVNAVRVAVPL